MPSGKTEVTEIVTGLAMLGYQDLQRALEVRPRHITHVDENVFDRLDSARSSGNHAAEFAIAWENGQAFARSPLGLRGRPPWTLEWKGHHKPASKSIETIPADLRVDHVYLISCKYGSRILHNSGPAALFTHCLAPTGPVPRADWFETVAAEAFRAVWQPIFVRIGLPPDTTPSATSTAQRAEIKAALAVDPLDITDHDYSEFVRETSEQSADRWRANLKGKQARSEMYWRLLRMQAAPYYVLGARHDGSPLRYRVDTPWDFDQHHTVEAFEVAPGRRGQPSVDWTVTVSDRRSQQQRNAHGHVEIRWSHTKLQGSPEAKVHLDSDPPAIPGYDAL